LHFDCFSGISGDMTLAALLDAGADAEAVERGLASLGLPIKLYIEKIRKGGFAATQVRVITPHEHVHRHLHDIEEIIGAGHLNGRQRELALTIFRRLAEAEARAHGIAIEKVHFHEVGALDSIADITGAAIALDSLRPEHVTSTPVVTGGGTVECAHGRMPVPTPGTAALLQGVPIRSSPIQAELTTPTGAAILTTVVDEWIDMPALTPERIGYGAGQMDLEEQPNVLRVFVGTSDLAGSGQAVGGTKVDTVWVLETNLDDVPAEVIGYCYDRLLAAGAVDVYTTPIFMKKNRPAVLLTALVPEAALANVEHVLFRETGTLGIRRYQAARRKLHRRIHTVDTAFGPIQGKLGWRTGEPGVFSPEYEACARIARQHNVPLREVYASAQQAYSAQQIDAETAEDTEK
jgi:uncharacterized protein (TIGR00299 family) protein